MDKNLIASSNIKIESTPKKVWNVLINPKKIKEYLFGTEVLSSCKIGSPIVFNQGFKILGFHFQKPI